MENYEERYGDVEPYQPYLQDGEKHLLTGRDASMNYWQAFYSAYSDRFPGRNFNYGKDEEEVPAEEAAEEAPAEEAAAEEVVEVEAAAEEVVAEKPCCCKKCKKNTGAAAVAFVASLLALALAAVSAFIKVSYTEFFSGIGTLGIYDSVMDVINGASGMMVHGYAACFIVAGVLTIASFITAIVALASKKAVCGVGAVALVALIATLGAGVLAFFNNGVGTDTESILCFLNPHVTATGVQWGFYFGAALLFIETVCGFASYRK